MKVNLKFDVSQLILSGKERFTVSDFSSIQSNSHDTKEHTYGEGQKEIISIKNITKNVIEDRFITLYFNYGQKYPYAPKVINANFEEKINPRNIEDIEPDGQFFTLIDILSQRLYVSDLKKKNFVSEFLKKKLDMEITIKPIIAESNFAEQIKTINSIQFTIEPNLFNSAGNQDLLDSHLVSDINGYGADRAKIILQYSKTRVSDRLSDRIKKIIGRKSDFKEVVIIGNNDTFENVFNLEHITSKIIIEIQIAKEYDMLREGEVFTALVRKIKSI